MKLDDQRWLSIEDQRAVTHHISQRRIGFKLIMVMMMVTGYQ